ncbi:nitroreductase family protein [Thauera sinica]|uniref:Molybdopterin biosynthesis protein MoeY n=1 Tax=Thauera sinica TaxID=2665146 RepID=A0ABW1ALC4_9RHOO|nr:molybdopterin biosynthesis protein MoeY [Thauera sp. K11]ATE59119.1 molybdopterin biosynthesis protein MoeY [Thauera sp. K11]
MASRDVLLKILDLARWAPSGDNTQPYRFEIVADDHIAVHGHDTRDWCVYDFDGHASHIAHGALLETLRIAASGHGLKATWSIRVGLPDTAPIYDVKLEPASGAEADPLLPFIETRTVQRRPMRTTPLSAAQRAAIADAPGAGFSVQFFEPLGARLRIARLLWDSAHIRLTCPEAYEVHKEVIEWGARYSVDRIPEQAVGVDSLTARLMRWVMHSWERVAFFNRYLGGTVAPRIQLDVIPAVSCAAHVLVRSERPLAEMGDFVDAGVALQRLWLTATAHGLHLQPEMTPLIFRWYVRAGRSISALRAIDIEAAAVTSYMERLVGAEPETSFTFFCRVGQSKQPASRSLRHSVDKLMEVPPS